MSPLRRTTWIEGMSWGLVVLALGGLGALWHHDRMRVWETPHWYDTGLVTLRAAHPFIEQAEPALSPRGAGSAGPGVAVAALVREGDTPQRPRAPSETWAVAVNPRCELCRGSLERAREVRGRTHAPFRLAVLVVDTPRRPSTATIASIHADELRWDSTGTWRHRWGHRVYGELLCFDRGGRFVRTLAPLSDTLAARRAVRFGEVLRRRAGS